MKRKREYGEERIQNMATTEVGGSLNISGLFGGIITFVLFIFIGTTLFGTISQEFDNALNCGIENKTIDNKTMPVEQPKGATDSFGGGGSGQFGGYDGKVHKSWGSNLAPIKTDKPMLLNTNCMPLDESMRTIAAIVPILFIISILVAPIGITSTMFRRVGVI